VIAELTAVIGVGSGDLLGIKDVKSIIESGKSKRSPTASAALARRIKPARAESWLTADNLLISNRTKLYLRQTNQLCKTSNQS
jgi:hypothetical protein